MATAPILRYALTTEPFPLQASPQSGNLTTATLTVVASNPTPAPVMLQGLIVTLPVGNGSTDLTPDATSISPIPPANWTLSDTEPSTGQVKYIFYPAAGHGAVGSDGLNFVFNDVEINRQTGTVAVEIMEGSNNCQPPDCPTKTLDLTKFPHGWGEVSFSSDPTNITYDTSTTLSWDGPQGATYTIQYVTPQSGVVTVPTTGQPPLSHSGHYPGTNAPPLTLTQTTTFTLNVEERINNQLYQAQQQVTVTIVYPPPKITQFTGAIERVGSMISLMLTWKTENATTCTISGVPINFKPNGSYTINPKWDVPLQTSYTLTASNADDIPVTSEVNLIWGHEPNTDVYVADTPSGIAISPDGTRLFVTNGGSPGILSVVDATADPLSIIGTLNLGKNTFPQGIAISKDGTRAFVALGGTNKIAALDITTDPPKVIGSPIDVGSGGPQSIVISKDGTRVAVANQYSPSVFVLDVTTDPPTVLEPPIDLIGDYGSAVSLAIAPDGSRIYAPSGDGVLFVIDAITRKLVKEPPLLVAAIPYGIAISPDGTRLYVTGNGTNDTVVLDVTEHPPKVLNQFLFGENANPQGTTFSPDGNRLFVAALQGNAIYVLDATADPLKEAQSLIHVGANKLPQLISASPDGAHVFFTNNRNSTISVLVPTSVTGGIGN